MDFNKQGPLTKQQLRIFAEEGYLYIPNFYASHEAIPALPSKHSRRTIAQPRARPPRAHARRQAPTRLRPRCALPCAESRAAGGREGGREQHDRQSRQGTAAHPHTLRARAFSPCISLPLLLPEARA